MSARRVSHTLRRSCKLCRVQGIAYVTSGLVKTVLLEQIFVINLVTSLSFV